MFSVIIPLYNKAETIGRAISSVLTQTFQDFEIVVVDDGSTDAGADVVKCFSDPRIRLIRQENGGVSAARNTGIEAARYDYLTFLDADDEYLPEFLERMQGLISRYPEAGMFGCGYLAIYPPDGTGPTTTKEFVGRTSGLIRNYFEVIVKSGPLFCSNTVCVKKNIMNEAGRFPVGIAAGEDLLTWATVCVRHSLAYSSDIGAIYYLPGFRDRKIRTKFHVDPIGEGLRKLLPTCPSEKRKYLKKYIAKWYGIRAQTYLDHGRHWAALVFIFKQIRQNPFGLTGYVLLLLNCMPSRLSFRIRAKIVNRG